MAVKRVRLTDMNVRKLVPPVSGRIEIFDSIVPSLSVRMTSSGKCSFHVRTRVRGHKNPTWFEVGRVPGISLAAARQKAIAILADCKAGQVPFAAEKAKAEEEKRQRRDTFAAVAEEFIQRHVAKLRSARDVENTIRRELIPRWGKRPIAEITRRDVVALLEEIVDSGRPYIARHLRAYVGKLFNWVIARDIYGIETSPCDRVSARDVIGSPEPRQRVLSDDELRGLWRATAALGGPNGAFVRLLILTGCRLREASNLQWGEVDLPQTLITLEAGRTKNATAFEIPLSGPALELLMSLPRGNAGPYAFSTTNGRRPVSNFSGIKERLDEMMGVGDWKLHDIRRTMRTRLSGLPIPAQIAELVIGHAQPGLHRVYDRHSHQDAKRRAMELWATELLRIVEPASVASALERVAS